MSAKPIPNSRITLIDDPSVEQNVAWGFHGAGWSDTVVIRTDKEGVATFSPLSYSEGTILVQAAGFAREHLGWHDHSEELNVTLAPEAVVSGELFDASTGKPMESVSIQLSSPTGGQFGASLQPGDAGRFRLGELPAGKYILSITTSAGAELHQEQLALEAGRHISRLLRLSSAAPAPAR
jgi:Carboxypeptidase regulatory-like domain